MKIALGAAQFGMSYGISNIKGQVKSFDVEKILRQAPDLGVDLIDTAKAYGDSETVIGRALSSTKKEFKIVTKFSDKMGAIELEENLRDSLNKLEQKSCYCYMVHNPSDFLSEVNEGFLSSLKALRDNGVVKKLGVSVYTPQQASDALSIFDFDVVQLPMSPFDQEFISSKCLEFLKDQNVEIHVRSIFLQGLVFLKPDQVNSFFAPVKDQIESFYSLRTALGLGPHQAVFSFLKEYDHFIDYLIIGVESFDQLQSNVEALNLSEKIDVNWGSFRFNNRTYSKPSNWRLG